MASANAINKDNTYFGVNGRLCGLIYGSSPPWNTHSLQEVKYPTDTFLVADSQLYTENEIPDAFDATCFGRTTGGYDTRARHGGNGLNLVFVDGHAEFAQPARWKASVPGGATYWCTSGGWAIYGWE